MEQFVSEGKICYYGISSNTFPSPETDFEHTSLNRVYEAAHRAAETVNGNGRANHFKVLQLPYNLLEHEALTAVNNRIDGNGVTVLEAAKSLGIGVLVNRPLNAFKFNRMNRLAHYPHDPTFDYQAAIASAVDSLQAAEDGLKNTLTDWGILGQVESSVNLDLFYNLAEKLPQFLPRIQNREHWEQIARQYIIPQINAYLLQTTRSCPDPKSDEWETASNEYVETINTLLSLVTGHFNRAASEEVDWIREALDAHLSEDERKLTFSQKALNFVAESSGVSVVLNGMKRREYVTDAMGIMAAPDFSTPAVELVEGVVPTDDAKERRTKYP
jgi:aryl-alcohol dehydrogenase-like predicted oxidoreductase